MIIWTCWKCGQPIADGAGYAEHPRPYADAEFEGFRATHRGCDDGHADTYWYAVERLRTGEDLSRSAEHMRTRQWWVEHEWSDFLADQLSSRVQSVTLTHPDPQSQGG